MVQLLSAVEAAAGRRLAAASKQPRSGVRRRAVKGTAGAALDTSAIGLGMTLETLRQWYIHAAVRTETAAHLQKDQPSKLVVEHSSTARRFAA